MDLVISRFEVYLINLDPTIGKEIKKTRPCLIISPDDMNKYISTIIIAPMKTKGRSYPTRIPCNFDGKDGQIVLDQIRTVDKIRIIRKLGKITTSTQKEVLSALTELFSE